MTMEQRVSVDPTGMPVSDPADRLPKGDDVVRYSVIVFRTPGHYMRPSEITLEVMEEHKIEASIRRLKGKKDADGTWIPGPVRWMEVFHCNGVSPVGVKEAVALRRKIREATAIQFDLEVKKVHVIPEVFDV